MLRLEGVRTRRGSFEVGPVDCEVADGELLALVGVNGSGKTTVLSALLGQVEVTGGAVVLDDDVVDLGARRHLARVGYVPDEEATVYPELTADEYYALLARVRDTDRAAQTLRHAADLAYRLGHAPGSTPFAAFSHGMRRKTQLVAALMHRPRLLLVDELSNGLDPLAAGTADRMLDDARADGAAVVVSTHDLAWVERRADRVVLLHGGRVVATGTVDEVRGRHRALASAYQEHVG
ncbi:MAG: ABC transporter ATP-binding protein [Propionibacteriales bacterium]|nr:ABC transporter ATP-binding protein [Propionibacteriales bacterium]